MLRKFFCFDLYTTGLMIGWLGLAESITSCITSILVLENVDTTIIPNITNDTNTNTTDVRSMVVSVLGSNIALNIIDLLASGLLIAGTIKRNHLLLLPWLINTTISLVFNFILLIAASVLIMSATDVLGPFIIFVVILFLIFVIYLYVYAAIYSLYHHIKRGVPNSEYSSLIEDRNAKGHPIYTRC